MNWPYLQLLEVVCVCVVSQAMYLDLAATQSLAFPCTELACSHVRTGGGECSQDPIKFATHCYGQDLSRQLKFVRSRGKPLILWVISLRIPFLLGQRR